MVVNYIFYRLGSRSRDFAKGHHFTEAGQELVHLQTSQSICKVVCLRM